MGQNKKKCFQNSTFGFSDEIRQNEGRQGNPEHIPLYAAQKGNEAGLSCPLRLNDIKT
jgi:hypothetical protein